LPNEKKSTGGAATTGGLLVGPSKDTLDLPLRREGGKSIVAEDVIPGRSEEDESPCVCISSIGSFIGFEDRGASNTKLGPFPDPKTRSVD